MTRIFFERGHKFFETMVGRRRKGLGFGSAKIVNFGTLSMIWHVQSCLYWNLIFIHATLRTIRLIESLRATQVHFYWLIQIRFNKTWEIFPSVARVLNIFLTTAANSASVERLNSKEGVPKVSYSIPSAIYAQRWARCSSNPANV